MQKYVCCYDDIWQVVEAEDWVGAEAIFEKYANGEPMESSEFRILDLDTILDLAQNEYLTKNGWIRSD